MSTNNKRDGYSGLLPRIWGYLPGFSGSQPRNSPPEVLRSDTEGEDLHEDEDEDEDKDEHAEERSSTRTSRPASNNQEIEDSNIDVEIKAAPKREKELWQVTPPESAIAGSR